MFDGLLRLIQNTFQFIVSDKTRRNVTGFRLGEILGLEWKDVNFDTNVITVNRTCLYSKAKGGLYTETPKTSLSMRSLKVPQGCSVEMA